jgi:hypothetical protein
MMCIEEAMGRRGWEWGKKGYEVGGAKALMCIKM